MRKIAVIGFRFCCKTGKRNRVVWEKYAELFPEDEIHIITGKKYLWDSWKEVLPKKPKDNLYIHQIPILFSRFGQFKHIFPSLLFKLHKIMPDVILADEEPIQPFVTWICALYAKIRKIPFFCYTYENQEKSWFWPISWMERFSVSQSKNVVCSSKDAAMLMEKRTGISRSNISIFPETGIDTKIFKKKNLWKDRKPILLFTGRFLAEKGIKELVEAKNLLKKKGRHFQWVFVGSGPMESFLKSEKDKDIKIIPWIKPEELPTYYNQAKIFLYPSLRAKHWEEQFGYSMAEALACGTPVISTPNSGAKEILPEKWMFVPFGDAKAISEKIIEISNSKRELDFGKYIEEHFSVTAIAKKWQALWSK